MSKVLKFRAWSKKRKSYRELDQLVFDNQGLEEIWVFPQDNETQQVYNPSEMIIEQYTGLKDKNGKEIYENCELDGRYRVEYIAPKFVGKDIIKGDIIELYDNKFTITKEHCEISQNSERGIN